MMRALAERAAATAGPDGMRVVGDYLARYESVCLHAFYNPTVYADAGIEGGRRLRAGCWKTRPASRSTVT